MLRASDERGPLQLAYQARLRAHLPDLRQWPTLPVRHVDTCPSALRRRYAVRTREGPNARDGRARGVAISPAGFEGSGLVPRALGSPWVAALARASPSWSSLASGRVAAGSARVARARVALRGARARARRRRCFVAGVVQHPSAARCAPHSPRCRTPRSAAEWPAGATPIARAGVALEAFHHAETLTRARRIATEPLRTATYQRAEKDGRITPHER